MKTQQLTKSNIDYQTGAAIVENTFNQLKKTHNINDVTLNIYELYDSSALGEANIFSKQIGISPKLFNDNVGSGYKRERQVQDKHNLTQNEFIIWIVCHEYAHVLYQTHQHTKDFFLKVEQLYREIHTRLLQLN